jgi:cyclomaltodextrinase / maltogenic alpha-amylase / neopullulanase
MNYHAFAYPVKGFLIDHALPASGFAEMLEARKTEYPEPVRFALQNLIDSHDTDRLASMVVNARPAEQYQQPHRFDYDVAVSPRWNPEYDVRKPREEEWEVVRLVALFQMTYLGAPMIYYGTEAGMWGADDPDDRKPMLWPDLTYEAETHHPLGHARPADPVAFDEELFAFSRWDRASKGVTAVSSPGYLVHNARRVADRAPPRSAASHSPTTGSASASGIRRTGPRAAFL